MTFWIIIAALALVVAVLLARGLVQPGQDIATDEPPDIALYKAQLRDIEKDLARGTLEPGEAERTRAEIGRRLLQADKAGGQTLEPAPGHVSRMAAGLVALTVIGGSLLLYGTLGAPGTPDLPIATRLAQSQQAIQNRPSQAQAEALAEQLPRREVERPEDYLALVEDLRAAIETRPDNLEGWTLLARHEAVLGNYAAAARAAERRLDILAAAATSADVIFWADRAVAAAGGIVTPEVEASLLATLETEPDNLPARYYLGLLYAQADRPDIAFRFWRDVAERGNPDLPHTGFARAQIEEAAFRAGLNYSLPDRRGPSAEDVAAAEDMSEEDRAAMIENMVSGLAARLADQGGPAEDWAQLITALGVLGRQQEAAEIYAEAREAFAGDPVAIDSLVTAATGAGLDP